MAKTKAKSKKPPDPAVKNPYKTIKTSLKSVLVEPDDPEQGGKIRTILTNAAFRMNDIMIHTFHLLKLYILLHYNMKIPLPELNVYFVTQVMKILCKESTHGSLKEETVILRKKLREFLNEHYRMYMEEELDGTNLTQAIEYAAEEVITAYENNIKQHYIEYIERYINVVYEKKKHTELSKSSNPTIKEFHLAVLKSIRNLKNDILISPNTPFISDNAWYSQEIARLRKLLLPNRLIEKNSVYYDLHSGTLDYLGHMIYMMTVIEGKGVSIQNVFPLRNDIIPKHFRVDTTSLIYLCIDKGGDKLRRELSDKKDEIWSRFFKIGMKCFRQGKTYRFEHQIMTDGVSCSILLRHKDLVKTRGRKPKNTPGEDEEYIDELKDYSLLQGKKVVAIDPNMRDLLYCVEGDTKSQTKFRYTQDRRRKETNVKVYRNYLQRKKKKTFIEGKNVEEWEAELSAYNKKTLNFTLFKEYLQKKNEINNILKPFYRDGIFRKLRLSSYIRTQQTEAGLINDFKKKFGDGKSTIIAFGDFEQRQHRKFHEPTKGKGFRTLLRKAGYPVYLVDEFRTSCRCSKCGDRNGECKPFRMCQNPRPWKREEVVSRHGLVECKTCSGLWNRDVNAASNIWKIAMGAINGVGRPKYLQRAGGSYSGAASVTTQGFKKP